MPASFTHPNGSVTFSRGPHRPDNSLAVVQPQRQSAANVRFGYAHTIAHETMSLRLRMTTAEKDQFLTFFNTTVNGMAEQFGYLDPQNTALLVMFNTPRLSDLTEKAYDAWEATVGIRIVGGSLAWSDGQVLAFDNGSAILGGF